MAGEEKKKPDLKSRLKNTQMGTGAGAAPTPAVGPDAGGETFASAPVTPAVAPVSSDDDLVVPDFIKQQMAEEAAAKARAAAEARRILEEDERREAAEEAARRRQAAIAADPFAAGAAQAPASAADFHIVVDEKPVDDAEVGRKRTGTLIAVVATGIVALGAGYLGGNQMSDREQANRTKAAVDEIRRQVDTAGAIISTMKEKVDHAAEAARLPPATPGGEDNNAPPPAGNPTIDPELATWFQAQQPEPPITPDSYAGRVGRLRPDLLQKLMKVQIELQEAWFQLRRHSEATTAGTAVINQSIQGIASTNADLSRLMVVFGPGGNNGPPVMGTLVFASPAQGAEGQFAITPAIPGTGANRGLYTAGDLAAANTLRTVGVPVARAGVPTIIAAGVGRPFQDYQARLRNIRSLVNTLNTDYRSLTEALNGQGH